MAQLYVASDIVVLFFGILAIFPCELLKKSGTEKVLERTTVGVVLSSLLNRDRREIGSLEERGVEDTHITGRHIGGIHISLVICVRRYTYPCDTDND